MKKFFSILILVALGAGGWMYYSNAAKNAAAERERASKRPVTSKAEVRDIEFFIQLTGEVIPAMQVEVKSEVGGKVKKFHARIGEQVKRGDLLAEIDDADLVTEMNSARTEIEGANLAVEKNRRAFERGKELYSSNLVSRENYDNLQSELALSQNQLLRAEAKLQQVQDRMSKTLITSPVDGTVLAVGAIEGQVVAGAGSVNTGTTLMNIADLNQLLIDSHVNQVDVANVEVNQKVKLTMEAVPDAEMDAVISFIAPVASVQNNIKGFHIEALLRDPHPRLRPGMTVNMRIPVASAMQAVSVPLSAVFDDGNGSKIVYVRNASGHERREVKVGVTNLFHAEITSGLEPGEEIYIVEPREARS